MKKQAIMLFLFIGLLFSNAYAVDTATAIDNPSFENWYYQFVEPDHYGIPIPNDWDNILLNQDDYTRFYHYANVEHDVVGGAIIVNSVPNGSYALGYSFSPQNWNGSSPSGYSSGVLDMTHQNDIFLEKDSNFIFSGYYYISGNETANKSLPLTSFNIELTGNEITFNQTISNEWKYFEVEYDNGVCTVNSGDVNCTNFAYLDISEITIDVAVLLGQSDKYNQTFLVGFDGLELAELEPISSTGDYYDLNPLQLNSYDFGHQQVCDGYTQYAYISGLNIDNLDFWQGKVMDSMKTKYIQVDFNQVDLTRVGTYHCDAYGVGVKSIEYWNGTDWVKEQHYDGFESTCKFGGSFQGGTTGCYFFHPTGYSKNDIDFSSGFIVPKDAFKFRIIYYVHNQYSGCGHNACGEWKLEFNATNTTYASENEINTNLANQSLPTYFPMLTQFVEQESKNLTSYHLYLINKLERDATPSSNFAVDMIWNENLIHEKTLNIANSSYSTENYDTSTWGIQTDDEVIYTYSGTYDFFGESYTPKSIYLFNSEEENICPSGCVEGSATYKVGIYENGSCSYTYYSCDSRCMPSTLNITLTNLEPTRVDATWQENFDYYDVYLYHSLSGNVTESDTTTSNSIYFSGLEPDVQYELEVNATEYYGCDLNLLEEYEFQTPKTSELPDSPYSDYITNGTQTINTWIDAGVTAFAIALGTTDVTARNMIWLMITLGISIAVTIALAEGTNGMIDVTVVFPISALIIMAIGWALGWLDILWLVLVGLVTGLMIFAKFYSLGSGGLG